MNKYSEEAGGIFTGGDMGPVGKPSGTGWKPPPPSWTPKTKQSPMPVHMGTGPVQPPQTQIQMPGGLDSFRSPQGFAGLASAFRPLTQAVMGYGGMQAMMGLYGMFSGSGDFSKAMAQNNYKPPPPPAAQRTVTASYRFPLPVAMKDGLAMPHIKKADSPTTPDLNDWNDALIGGKVALPGPPKPYTPPPPGPPAPTAMDYAKRIAPHVATNMAVDVGLNQAFKPGQRLLAAKYPGVAANAIPRGARFATGLKGSLLMDTPVNIATDLLELGGIYDKSGNKPYHVWQKPTGNGRNWQYGFNPSAMGWDMNQHREATTPDDTIAFGWKTKHEPLNAVGSYLTSGLNAYSDPAKSLASGVKAQAWDFNPVAQAAFNPEEREGWSRLASGRPLVGQHNTSIPLTYANRLMTNPSAPNAGFQPGGKLHKEEAANYLKRDRYHPTYNPGGTNERPWVGSRWWDALWR